MKLTGCDARPRVFIEPNRDGVSCVWKSHPAARGEFAATPGAALDAALATIGHEAAVIIFGPCVPP